MKAGRVATVGILFIAILVVSGARAEGQGKPGKPPFTGPECIVFTGELEGKLLGEGCCPNRGPFPAYTMTLSDGILTDIPGGEYPGNVFMNQWGPGRTRQYIVQFWTPNDELLLEVKGGVVREETKNKLTVGFDSNNSVCRDYSMRRDQWVLDGFVTLYQAICFPVYKIAKVRRSRYIVLDRQQLEYLNFVEKFDCSYCAYASGPVSYVYEIVARTEQYFCPIKHARRILGTHSRYPRFLDYGEAANYPARLEAFRVALAKDGAKR